MKRLSLTSTLLPGAAIDRDARVIKGVSVITGDVVAHGHNAPPFVTDGVLLQQVAQAINNSGNGVRVRLTHAEVEGVDSLPLLLGKIRNARVEGNQVKADFHFGNYANPTEMNRLFSLAEEAPEDCGLSIVPEDYDFVEEQGELRLRVKSLFAVDWVGTPAANPAGMFSKQPDGALPSAGSQLKGSEMDYSEKQMEYLRANGLPEGATEEEVAAMVAAFSAEQSAAFAALAEVEPIAKEEEEEHVVPAPAAGKKEEPKPALSKKAEPDVKANLSEINDIAKLAGLGGDWAVEMFLAGKSPAEARKVALEKKRNGKEPVVITGGEDRNRVSLSEAIPQAIALRAGIDIKNAHERASQLRSLSVVDMARHHYAALGVKNAFDLGRNQVVRLMSNREFRKAYPALAGAQGTDDFDSLLADTINKTLRLAYEDAPSSWSIWARKATAPDFKTIRRAAMSEVPSLTSVTESQELQYVTMGDSSETYTLTEYKGGLRLTRQAIVNDDLDAFGRIPKLQGLAAKRKEDDVAYAILTANGNLADGGALFNATAVTTTGGHANLTSSGTAMSVTSLGVAYAAMFNQKGSKNAAFLELIPKFLLVPSTKAGIAQQLINSTVDPADNKGHATNPYTNRLQVVPSARLDSNSTTAWYLVADNNVIDTVEVCFLEGEESPVLSQETDFDTDDMKFKVRHTVAAAAIDFRGLYKNNGA